MRLTGVMGAASVALVILLAACEDKAGRDGDASYPSFESSNYRYVQHMHCHCRGNDPVRVTVKGGAVVGAVYAVSSPDYIPQSSPDYHERGAAAPGHRNLTINDLIAIAEESGEAVWPDDQDFPDEVIDEESPDTQEDEISYQISRVKID